MAILDENEPLSISTEETAAMLADMGLGEDNSKDIKDEEVKTKCLQWISSCSSNMEELQLAREVMMKSYQRQKYGNEITGRSQFVMSDVYDTIEAILPSLMRVFYGGQDVVNISPMGPEDEQAAKLMEQKVNFDFQRKMNGFQILYDFFKDALMYKTGVVKWYWNVEKEIEVVNYEGLTEEEYQQLSMNAEYEIKEAIPTTQALPDGSAVSIYNIKAHKLTDISGPMVVNLRPDEFIFPPNTRSVKEADFVCHKKAIKRQEVAKYGLDPDDITDMIADPRIDVTYRQMWEDLGGVDFITPDDKTTDEVWVYECYLNEYDEEGKKIPKIATLVGSKLVQYTDNPYGQPPFAVASPIRQQHRMAGTGIAELVVDIQKLRTSLTRYVIDNIYYQNNGVTVINPFRIDANMYKTNNVPGGMVFTKGDWEPSGHLFPIPIKPMAPWVMDMMEYVDGTIKENRTGITKYNQGLDSKSLNRTASGISQIMSASQQRIELIARMFAECEDGVKAIFQALVDMNLKFFSGQVNLRLNNVWQTINPEDISGKYDIIIDVGGGTGTKEMKVNQLMQMMDKYAGIAGSYPMIVTPQNVYNLLAAVWENMGYKNASLYATDPAQPNPTIGWPGTGQAPMPMPGQQPGQPGGQPGMPPGPGAPPMPPQQGQQGPPMGER